MRKERVRRLMSQMMVIVVVAIAFLGTVTMVAVADQSAATISDDFVGPVEPGTANAGLWNTAIQYGVPLAIGLIIGALFFFLVIGANDGFSVTARYVGIFIGIVLVIFAFAIATSMYLESTSPLAADPPAVVVVPGQFTIVAANPNNTAVAQFEGDTSYLWNIDANGTTGATDIILNGTERITFPYTVIRGDQLDVESFTDVVVTGYSTIVNEITSTEPNLLVEDGVTLTIDGTALVLDTYTRITPGLDNVALVNVSLEINPAYIAALIANSKTFGSLDIQFVAGTVVYDVSIHIDNTLLWP